MTQKKVLWTAEIFTFFIIIHSRKLKEACRTKITSGMSYSLLISVVDANECQSMFMNAKEILSEFLKISCETRISVIFFEVQNLSFKFLFNF